MTRLPLTLILACGPLAPPVDAGPALSSGTGETTTPNPTTTGQSTPTTATITAPTTIDVSTSGTSSTGAQNFIITPDGNMGPIQCNPYEQDCPPGQKCAAWAEDGSNAWNATKCVDIMGDAAPGEPCSTNDGAVSGNDTCALGAMCWDVDQTNHGTCVALCTGPPEDPSCPPAYSCFISGDGILNLCLTECHPVIQDCAGDALCVFVDDAFRCVGDASGNVGQSNDPCELPNGCDKGLACISTATASSACQQDSQGCCQPFCEFPDAQCPNPDQQCIQWYDPMMPIPAGLEDVGICKLPQ